jgi:putative FmdB family regulatory protein
MPIYEFQCKTCHCRFEEILPSGHEVMPECPRCGTAEAVVKEFSAYVTKSAKGKEPCAPRGGFS